MDNTSLPSQSGSPILDPRIFTDAVLKFAADQKSAGQQLTGNRIANDSSMLRDYSNIALLALGGAVTYLTVGKHLIKTPGLFYVAMVSLVVTVVLSVLVRRALNSHLDKVFEAHEERYTELTNLATLAYLDPRDQGNQTRLNDAMKKQFSPPAKGFIEKYGASVVNAIFLLGFLGLAISLIFKISS